VGDVLGELKPTAVWKHFEEICSIPRPSGKEERAAAHVRQFAQSRGLDYESDKVGNVLIRKAPTSGMEGRRTVVLQTHLDMVPQKNQDVNHDFEKDPIRPSIDGDAVRAQGTTLGADNGIGVATALAVLESNDLTHGPIEALFTIDEETGLTGANNLQPGVLQGDILFNLDSEDEGEICVGCAGGANVDVRFEYTPKPVPKGSVAMQVDVTGLKGGHSGVDIHLGRANANKVMTRILWEARGAADLRIARWSGGDLRNAIPRYAQAVVIIPKKKAKAFLQAFESMASVVKAEFHSVDPDLSITAEKTRLPRKSMGKASSARLLNALYACPNGVFAMMRDMPEVTETSTNLAVVEVAKGKVAVTNLVRSAVETKKTDVANQIRGVFELVGGKVNLSGAYPGWQPNVTSPVLAMLKETYKQKFGVTPAVTATHGGLECGIIRSLYPDMDAVSFGPTIRFPHSPDEHVDIPSVQKFWDFLVDALGAVPAR
jgi:dipeptidase D